MDAAPVNHLHELRAATERFAALLGSADGAEPVPACPGWTVRDLAVHLGGVHRWAAAIVLSGQRVTAPEPLVEGPLADWYAGTADALLAALAAVNPEEQVPNFSRLNEQAAFWPRRQMHETVVHTIDVAQALGRPEHEWTVAPAIAADGVDEVLQVFFPRLTAGGRRPDVRGRIRLVATDVDQSWIVGPGSDEGAAPVQVHPSLDADSSASGTAADLYLGLWHRIDHARLELDGAHSVAMFAGATTP